MSADHLEVVRTEILLTSCLSLVEMCVLNELYSVCHHKGVYLGSSCFLVLSRFLETRDYSWVFLILDLNVPLSM